VGFAGSQEIPERYIVEQNYPNPFNPTTTIRFGIPNSNAERTTLIVYDVVGREIAVLVNERLNAGVYSVSFETHGLSSGIYFYRLVSGTFTQTRKMQLLR
jgi:hypothetical protein